MLRLRGDAFSRIISAGLARLAIAALVGLATVSASPALACRDPDAGPTPQAYAARFQANELAIAQSQAEAGALATRPVPEALLEQVRLRFDVSSANYRYRTAIRDERADIFKLAADSELADQVVARLPAGLRADVADSLAGVQALWRLSGVSDLSKVRIPRHRGHPVPVGELRGYYLEAAARYNVYWSYLASINFIESDFGRVLGPSSAGAVGPMQFLPATWESFGQGDISSPHDSVLAAARYLAHYGAPGDMPRAVWHYNQDSDYVESVIRYAAAMRRNPGWLDRYYYWYTEG